MTSKQVETSDMMTAVKKMGYELIPKQDGKDKMDHKERGNPKATEEVHHFGDSNTFRCYGQWLPTSNFYRSSICLIF